MSVIVMNDRNFVTHRKTTPMYITMVMLHWGTRALIDISQCVKNNAM